MASDSVEAERSRRSGSARPAKIVLLHGAALVLRIELRNIRPVIHRTIVVPCGITLSRLHMTLLRAMGWNGGHLHEFVINGVRYGEPDPEYPEPGLKNERRLRLDKVLEGATRFEYVYDFGDHWAHEVRVVEEAISSGALDSPWCLEGANACPPEDVGGAPGYLHFLQAIADPTHPEHDEMLRWHGKRFDPAAFDLQEVNQRLRRVRV